jgi:hypothetical protein
MGAPVGSVHSCLVERYDRRHRSDSRRYPNPGLIAARQDETGARNGYSMERWIGELKMNTKRSLRLLVDKWLGVAAGTRVRVTRFGRVGPKKCRFVRVEATSTTGALAILFFYHGDGLWCVFPPDYRRPAMNVSAMITA